MFRGIPAVGEHQQGKVIDRVWEYLGIDLRRGAGGGLVYSESYTSGGYNDEMTVGGYSTVQKSGSSAFRTGAAITGRICERMC